MRFAEDDAVLHLIPSYGALQLARTAVGSVAEDAGASRHAVADLCLAVDEVMGFLLRDAAVGGGLTVRTGGTPAPWFQVSVVPGRPLDVVPDWLGGLLDELVGRWTMVSRPHAVVIRCRLDA